MTGAVVIDTNAYSMFRRGAPELLEIFTRVPRLVLPLVVLAELLAGFAGGTKAKRNRADLAVFLASPRVILARPDRDTAEIYALVFQQLRTDGHPIPTNDIWVAATALQQAMPLISLDTHFQHVRGLGAFASLEALTRAGR